MMNAMKRIAPKAFAVLVLGGHLVVALAEVAKV